MKKIFINGSHGTTGLRIYERLLKRSDIEILNITENLRKDSAEIKKLIESSDITILCLPDEAAIEAVKLCENKTVRFIDTSTAHRTNSDWAYGFPELSLAYREKIKNSRYVTVPGCHATGFISLVYPLVRLGIMSVEYPVVAFSLTGYSGGGKKMIADYQAQNRDIRLDSPRQYGITQNHKHLKEMQAICMLADKPIFSPVVADYYSGMTVSVPLVTDLLDKKISIGKLEEIYREFYRNQKLINIMPCNSPEDGFIPSNLLSGKDNLNIYINGNDERIIVSAVFDNLGKGASGAAVQCFNIMTGCDEITGLEI